MVLQTNRVAGVVIMWINSAGQLYVGDMQSGDREATAAEVDAWTMSRTKDAKRAEIETAYAAAVSFLDNYPASERLSWGDQEAEALAFVANNAVPTPTLSAIAARTGETIVILAGKVIANADAFKAAGGDAIGRRRARMKAIDAAVAANDMTALQAVVW